MNILHAQAKAMVFNMMELLGPNGENWVKGSLFGENISTQCCLIGSGLLAMNKMGLVDRSTIATFVWDKIMTEIRAQEFFKVDQWNDAPERTFADVRALLEKVYEEIGR